MQSRNKREGWYFGRMMIWRSRDPDPFKLRMRNGRTKRYVASLEGFKAWNKSRIKQGKPAIKERPNPF